MYAVPALQHGGLQTMPVACVGQAVRAKTGRPSSAVVRTDVPAAARLYLSLARDILHHGPIADDL